jgi:parallel beta-helix repeat protein
MKTRPLVSSFACLFAALLFPAAAVFAQGSLTPPGAPAPTMKSLDQVEPRTPISSLPFVITNAGSYYLTANLNAPGGNGITINNNNVTLDLNGFALTGSSSGLGIHFPDNFTNVTVRNGSISKWSAGVYVQAGSSRNLVFEHLAVSRCGAGINCNSPALVRDCVCTSNNLNGIVLAKGQITDCDASGNGSVGIYINGGIVRNCHAADNGSLGIYAIPGTVTGCLVENNRSSGIFINAPGSEVIGNICIGNNTSAGTLDAGIYVNDSNNRVEDNHVYGSGYSGISVSGTYNGNVVVKNYVSGNGSNNYLAPGNQAIGPLITTYGTITNSNPWANFSY